MEKIDQKSTLKSIPVFSELSIEQLREISEIGSIHKYSKGENLFRAGDYYRGFYILLKGIVKVYDLNKEGKETVIHIIKPVNVFADIPLFEGKNYPVSADAIEDSIALFIPKEEFINLIMNNPEISLKMLAGFAKRMKSLVKQIEDLSSKEVINRLAKYIIKEVKKSGTENLPEPFIKLAAPKSVIASYIGTITETFSRTLNKLQSEKIIRVQGKKIFINNLSELKKLADN
ncbi:MAG: Crp/Fnr family transcriptional regulator [Melioribacteraceae bacterium]|jgi:CRP/FNR family transcriptional regulator|nr:Crp/Fnr family transcriptional regulator [Melioribacteraceae bacterium]WKZ70081.1 MAG: Crp/Fnr family transcriptional regulator [Melioribacteraceae bacterium]